MLDHLAALNQAELVLLLVEAHQEDVVGNDALEDLLPALLLLVVEKLFTLDAFVDILYYCHGGLHGKEHEKVHDSQISLEGTLSQVQAVHDSEENGVQNVVTPLKVHNKVRESALITVVPSEGLGCAFARVHEAVELVAHSDEQLIEEHYVVDEPCSFLRKMPDGIETEERNGNGYRIGDRPLKEELNQIRSHENLHEFEMYTVA